MRSLYIIRHAKSSWNDYSISDFDRPLDSRGHHDAPQMAAYLKSLSVSPTLFISSPAKRALTTCAYFCNEFDMNIANIIQKEHIYEAVPSDIIEIINEIDNAHEVVFLFGHNPSLSYFANLYFDGYFPEIPTCGIVRIDFDGNDWSRFNRTNAAIISQYTPKSVLEKYA